MATVFNYTVSTEFTGLTEPEPDQISLLQEVADSSIVPTVISADLDIAADNWRVEFSTDLSGAEETTLDGVVAAHTGVPLPGTEGDGGSAALLGQMWYFDDGTADANPGTGNFRYNNATQSSATALIVNDSSRSGVDMTPVLLGLKTNDRVYIQTSKGAPHGALVRVTGAPTDNAGWVTVPIAVESSMTDLVDEDQCTFLVSFVGAENGDVSGPGSSTDEAIVRWDGTGGDTIQNSSVLIDDSDNMSGVVDLTMSGALIGRDYTELTPSAIASQQNNYDPTGFGTADLLRITLTGSQTITGFAAPGAGDNQHFWIANIDTTDTLTLADESASSTAANRIITQTGSDLDLEAGEVAELVYDDTSTRWRIVGVAQAAGGGGIGGSTGATDNAVITADGTGGSTVQATGVIINDSDQVDEVETLTYVSEHDNGNSGASATINWNNGQQQEITLTANCTLSFTAPPGPGMFLLRVVQDGGGLNSLTWPGDVLWPNGVSQSPAAPGNAESTYVFYYNGTDYYASRGGGLAGWS